MSVDVNFIVVALIWKTQHSSSVYIRVWLWILFPIIPFDSIPSFGVSAIQPQCNGHILFQKWPVFRFYTFWFMKFILKAMLEFNSVISVPGWIGQNFSLGLYWIISQRTQMALLFGDIIEKNLFIKLPLLKIILLRVHSWLKKMLHFPFLPLQRIEVLSRVLGEPLMLLLSFKMEIPRKKLENRTFENILGGSH